MDFSGRLPEASSCSEHAEPQPKRTVWPRASRKGKWKGSTGTMCSGQSPIFRVKRKSKIDGRARSCVWTLFFLPARHLAGHFRSEAWVQPCGAPCGLIRYPECHSLGSSDPVLLIKFPRNYRGAECEDQARMAMGSSVHPDSSVTKNMQHWRPDEYVNSPWQC